MELKLVPIGHVRHDFVETLYIALIVPLGHTEVAQGIAVEADVAAVRDAVEHDRRWKRSDCIGCTPGQHSVRGREVGVVAR